ncbi:MAG: thioredoxin [Euryarchaeota archaeon]|nr:thioredoxin [Euryarchaeota archaeon]MDE1880016.1 thioredoxin [Euryarchaeota archaeon]MDE2046155.1 thioredoxin [Thermoplasmata archaeon]
MTKVTPPAEDRELYAWRAKRTAELQHRPSPAPPSTSDPSPAHLTSATFTTFLQENPRAVVDVWAPWCGPCRYLAPTVDALAHELDGAVKFGKLNSDEEPDIPATFGVQGIPTLLLFQRGKLVDRVVGAMPKDVLNARIHRAFGLGGNGT